MSIIFVFLKTSLLKSVQAGQIMRQIRIYKYSKDDVAEVLGIVHVPPSWLVTYQCEISLRRPSSLPAAVWCSGGIILIATTAFSLPLSSKWLQERMTLLFHSSVCEPPRIRLVEALASIENHDAAVCCLTVCLQAFLCCCYTAS
jgi:hypothetical protein